ncbi:MAG: glycosyltransferase [Lachnospiraceae bacterium]|nr:glycosyltransferase [Lachnospiraceae bacterium]
MKRWNILFYQNNHRMEKAFLAALQQVSDAKEFSCPLRDEAECRSVLPLILQLIQEQQAELLFSFEYLPTLSEACNRAGILYFSYLCEVPTLAPFAEQLQNACNVFLVADTALGAELQAAGAENVFYLPMAPMAAMLPEQRRQAAAAEFPAISFVGELYQDNMYKYFAKLPDTLRGYLDGVMAAQSQVYGLNFFEKLISEEFWNTLSTVLQLKQQGNEKEKCRYMIENFFFVPQVTHLERKRIVKALAGTFGERFCLYAKEKLTEAEQVQQKDPYVGRRLTELYRNTLNVNVTDRANKNGISAQVWDILASGGLLFSNYQQDLVEMFVPGQEFILYESEVDLLEKLEYYLAHPEEGRQIAQSAQQKVLTGHTWEHRVQEMLSLLG